MLTVLQIVPVRLSQIETAILRIEITLKINPEAPIRKTDPTWLLVAITNALPTLQVVTAHTEAVAAACLAVELECLVEVVEPECLVEAAEDKRFPNCKLTNLSPTK